MDGDKLSQVLQVLESRPKRLTDTEMWLFVTVNTARALIDSTDKKALENAVFSGCRTVAEIQYGFDTIQGRYAGRFRSTKNEVYNYLCSLIAFFPDRELTQGELALIDEYSSIDRYIIYEL